MNEKEFKKLLSKQLQGNASFQEQELLEEFLQYRLKKHQTETIVEDDVKQRVLGNAMANIKFKRRKTIYRTALKYAAILIVGLGISYAGYKWSFGDKVHHTLQLTEITSGNAERKTIFLPDSSKLVLNANSCVRFAPQFNGGKRLVELSGEAFFQVTHDKSKPFVVQTEELSTTVLGTSFNIQEKDSLVKVTVATGKVGVRRENRQSASPVLLTKNMQYSLDLANDTVMIADKNAQSVSDWSRGIIQLENVPLDEAIGYLNQWFDANIYTEDEILAKRKIRAQYKKKSLEYILEDLKFLLEIEYYKKGDTIILKNQ